MKRTLLSEYGKRKTAIKRRLREFRGVWDQPERRIFSELCFCICTPQSKAVYCDKAVSGLERSGILFNGTRAQIRAGLKAVRFPNNKAGYIVETRRRFTSDKGLKIKEKIRKNDIKGTREWLVRNVKGIGFKEASHFLRNIGLGEELAILDVHILKNMTEHGVIRDVPKSISRKTYYELEEKFRAFSRKIKIPMAELDLLMWASETGEVFK